MTTFRSCTHRAWCAYTAVLALGLLGGSTRFATAQEAGRIDLAISSAPSPVGAGARAAGVGSAFIALADDATAASWNPGGLIQLERPEVSLVGLGTRQIDDVPDLDDAQGTTSSTAIVGESSTDSIHLNYASAALPFAWRGRNFVVSFNYQELFRFDRDVNVNTSTSSPAVQSDIALSVEQDGALYAYSPAIAAEILPSLSMGVALNVWTDGIARDYAWRTVTRSLNHFRTSDGTVDIESSARFDNRFQDFQGTNATIGALFRSPVGLSVGAVAKIPFRATFRLHGDIYDGDEAVGARDEELRMELPMTLGLGVAVRPFDQLTLSSDVTYVPWGDFRVTDRLGNEYYISGDPVAPSFEGQAPSSGVDPVTTVRAGLEYLVEIESAQLALRCGGFYDPEPGRGAPSPFWGGSVGVGVSFDHLSLDLAYQVRFGDGAKGLSVLNNIVQLPEATIDVQQHNLYSSIIVYF